jgi:hypothetical protein
VWYRTLHSVFQGIRLLSAGFAQYLPESVVEFLCAALQQSAQIGYRALVRAEVGSLEVLQGGAGAIKRR